MTHQLFRPAGSLVDGPDPLLITPERAGWQFSGLRVIRMSAGDRRTLELGPMEGGILPLAGSCEVEVEGESFRLAGRQNVFEGVSDFVYLPLGASAVVTATRSGEFAIPMAVANRHHPARYLGANEIPIEVRGAGQATRQINNFASADSFDGADKLIAVEVITPAGNWSSYPPHKHDEHTETEVPLEEIYYFRIDNRRGEGFGFHRTYTTDNEIDATVTVRDGDAFLIPRGFHGPCVAAPGYHMYYLNVMAGPLEERVWRICDDPAHAWVKEEWTAEPLDSRLPMYTA